MNTFKIFFTTFLIGIVSGFISMFFLLNSQSAFKNEEIKVTQIRGEKIYHGDFISEDSIKLKTISDVKGEIKTEIPKMLVPEPSNG